MNEEKCTVDSQHCLICSGKFDTSDRTSLQIFSEECQISPDRPLTALLSNVLEEEINEETVHSDRICQKCFQLFSEVDELQQRLLDLKEELLSSYRRAAHTSKVGAEGSEDDEAEEIVVNMEVAPNQVPKKILDIPSSDDEQEPEGTQETRSTRKITLQTMEEIEMALVKMHGGLGKDDSKSQDVGDDDDIDENGHPIFVKNDEESNEAVEAEEADAEDAEDEDSQDNTEALLEAAAIAEKSLVTKVKVEVVDDEQRPNTLKRKMNVNILGNNGAKKEQEYQAKKIKTEDCYSVEQQNMVIRDGELYTCMLCEGDETVCGEAKAITQHIKMVHDTRIYICDVCGDHFKKRTDLSAHLDDHVATEEGDFQCEVCNRIFSNLRLFRIHKRMHYPQNKAWSCDTCGKKYSSRNLLEEHMNTHTGVRPYICQVCGKDFASKYTFKAHEKTHEVRPRPFTCHLCGKTFLSQQNLTQHERTHTGIKEFSCHLCGKQFGSAHNLEVHSIVHTGYKPFICGLCGKAFARKAEIRDHERTHTGERPYQCEFCGATFSQRSNLQSHKRATHYDDKRYKCEECGKGFKRRRLLDYHTKAAHTGERPFKCSVCEATFVYPEHFKKHRRIHTGEKPFLCEVCGKAFNSRDNRNAHRFVHSDKKPYECLVCGAGFMRKPLLYQHMQTQGHLNDTIVVNQPRLTTEDDQLITVNNDGEMEIVTDNVRRLESIDEENTQESKYFVTEQMLVDGTKVLEQADGTLILGDSGEEAEAVEHIIIDGQQIQFAEAEDDETGEIDDEAEAILANAEEYEGIITPEAIAGGQTQIIQTKEGPIQLVAVRIPNDKGEEEEAWIKIMPDTSHE